MDKVVNWLDSLANLGTPHFWQRFHGLMALLWVLLIPIAVVTVLKESIVFLIFVSLMTAFSGEMAALHGVTVQKNQEEKVSDVHEDVHEPGDDHEPVGADANR